MRRRAKALPGQKSAISGENGEISMHAIFVNSHAILIRCVGGIIISRLSAAIAKLKLWYVGSEAAGIQNHE